MWGISITSHIPHLQPPVFCHLHFALALYTYYKLIMFSSVLKFEESDENHLDNVESVKDGDENFENLSVVSSLTTADHHTAVLSPDNQFDQLKSSFGLFPSKFVSHCDPKKSSQESENSRTSPFDYNTYTLSFKYYNANMRFCRFLVHETSIGNLFLIVTVPITLHISFSVYLLMLDPQFLEFTNFLFGCFIIFSYLVVWVLSCFYISFVSDFNKLCDSSDQIDLESAAVILSTTYTLRSRKKNTPNKLVEDIYRDDIGLHFSSQTFQLGELNDCANRVLWTSHCLCLLLTLADIGSLLYFFRISLCPNRGLCLFNNIPIFSALVVLFSSVQQSLTLAMTWHSIATTGLISKLALVCLCIASSSLDGDVSISSSHSDENTVVAKLFFITIIYCTGLIQWTLYKRKVSLFIFRERLALKCMERDREFSERNQMWLLC